MRWIGEMRLVLFGVKTETDFFVTEAADRKVMAEKAKQKGPLVC